MNFNAKLKAKNLHYKSGSYKEEKGNLFPCHPELVSGSNKSTDAETNTLNQGTGIGKKNER